MEGGRVHGGRLGESLSESRLERMADDALLRFPEECDARFRIRKMAIARVRGFVLR